MKFRPLSIILMGLAIFVVGISYGYFTYYTPNEAEARYYNKYADDLQAVANQLSNAEARVHLATKLVNQSRQDWAAIVATRTPSDRVATGGIDLGVSAWQLAADGRTYRNNVQREINKQLQVGGVKLPNGGPLIQPLGDTQDQVLASLNYPSYAFPVAIFQLNGITVEGTYDQIMANYKAWGRMPNYIAMPDGLLLSGTSPDLRGTYNVIIVGFIKAKGIFPPQPDRSLGGR
jgi:hypothetical protein